MSAPRNARAITPNRLAAFLIPAVGAALIATGHGLALLILLALAAAALAAARLSIRHRTLQNQVDALRAVADPGDEADEDPDAPLRRFLLAAKELTGFERGIVWMENEAGSGLRARVVLAGPDSQDSEVERAPAEPDPLVLQALGRQAPLLMPRVDSTIASVDAARSESWLLCPVGLRGRSIGVAQFISPSAKPFARQQARMVEPLAALAAAAFEAACVRRLMYRYADLAEVDGLTGIANRRRICDLLNAEVERSARYGHPLAVMMLDVDGFKAFNDRYGHPQGDRLLQAIARVLRAGVRRVDHVGRYGGEEFIVVLPETARDAAYALAERLRAAVESEGFDTGIGTTVRKTVSIGVSSLPEDAHCADELVQHADDALYRAKRAGKNRVLAG